MFFSALSSFHSTLPNLYVQPTVSDDAQSLHPLDAVESTSMLPATSSVTFGTGTIHTMLSDSALPHYSITTVELTCIHGPSLSTTSQHPIITHRFYQGIWL